MAIAHRGPANARFTAPRRLLAAAHRTVMTPPFGVEVSIRNHATFWTQAYRAPSRHPELPCFHSSMHGYSLQRGYERAIHSAASSARGGASDVMTPPFGVEVSISKHAILLTQAYRAPSRHPELPCIQSSMHGYSLQCTQRLLRQRGYEHGILSSL